MAEVKQTAALMRALREFRELDPNMPLPQAMSLLLIAENEGLSFKELAQKLGLGVASVSRYVSDFSVPRKLGAKGAGLVVAVEDPFERRKKIITLTSKGRALINKMTMGV